MRIDKIIQSRKQKEPEPDPSVLTDEELDFYCEALDKAGYEWNKEGDISLLTDAELKRIEKLNQKMVEAGHYAN
jgi:hypothetical protein